ncbi:MAG: peptidase MA family metallohydrolase [Chloroflexota bacterium]
MNKKFAVILLLTCLLAVAVAVAVGPAAAQSQAGPRVLASAATVDFPARLNFILSAASDVPISDVRLQYRVERTSFARVTAEAMAQFTPGSQVQATYTLDMRRTGGLPPGTGVQYWWRVTDARGRLITTEASRVLWDDARYTWRNVSEGPLTVYWYQGSESFARQILAAAQAALPRLSQDSGTLLAEPVAIYLYSGSKDLQGAMIFPNEWTGGSAYPDYGTITLGVSPGNLDWGVKTVAHEMAHLVVHRLTNNPYLEIPVWLDEGLAMYAEGPLDKGLVSVLDRAVAAGRLFSVRSLASPFSAFTDQSLLSYAQSYSIVEFLINRYGQAKMLELLGVFHRGSDYDSALETVYGFDMGGLNQLWRDYVRQQYLPPAVWQPGETLFSAMPQPELTGVVR